MVAARANPELVLPTTGTEVLDLPMLPAEGGSQPARVHAGLRDAILGGRLPAGTRLPSSRALAAQLGVRRNAVVLAYEQLGSDGLAEGRQGAGTFVAARLPTVPAPFGCGDAPIAPPHPVPGAGPFAVGRTHPDPALLNQLGRLVRRSLAAPGPAPVGYGDARGSEALRQAIAGHLAATRHHLRSRPHPGDGRHPGSDPAVRRRAAAAGPGSLDGGPRLPRRAPLL